LVEPGIEPRPPAEAQRRRLSKMEGRRYAEERRENAKPIKMQVAHSEPLRGEACNRSCALQIVRQGPACLPCLVCRQRPCGG
jgi:hypothetical protein